MPFVPYRVCLVMRIAWLLVLCVACGDSHTADDAGRRDSSVDSGGDAGSDSGDVDSGNDSGGTDAGSPVCEHHTDCTLVPVSCCGDCGAYTRDDISSVHDDLVAEQRMNACPDGLACPPCFNEPDPALQATCEGGSCGYVDLYDPEMGHTSEFTECTDDSDCVLRVVDCCECGAEIRPGRLVAIHVDQRASFTELVCEPGTACDDCVPTYEPYFTWCGADSPEQPRRCRVDVVGP